MRLEWSSAAVSDLKRFGEFLHDRFPSYAALLAETLIAKSQMLLEHPELGKPLERLPDFRQIVVRALRAAYVIQYRIDGDRIVILRVFHGRESRP